MIREFAMLNLTFSGARILWPEGFRTGSLSISGGRIAQNTDGRCIDLSGFMILPGIVDVHGDGFERHLAPRRGVQRDLLNGLLATEAELAANGITTGVLAQFWSWEGGMRGPEFAARVFRALFDLRHQVSTQLLGQLRLEIHMTDDFDRLPNLLADWDVSYVVFNDHLPYDDLVKGRKPARLISQALRAGRDPQRHYQLMMDLLESLPNVSTALDTLTAQLVAQSRLLGSHDEETLADRSRWRKRGVYITEFPTSHAAAEYAGTHGDRIVLGAPNIARGGSHKGNVSACELVRLGLCDALASDYHYPSLRQAVFTLVDEEIMDFAEAWRLVSDKPAHVLGLADRGRFQVGLRADIVFLDIGSRRIAATMAGGKLTYMSGNIAQRFFGVLT